MLLLRVIVTVPASPKMMISGSRATASWYSLSMTGLRRVRIRASPRNGMRQNGKICPDLKQENWGGVELGLAFEAF